MEKLGKLIAENPKTSCVILGIMFIGIAVLEVYLVIRRL